jgi:hypothetical protein
VSPTQIEVSYDVYRGLERVREEGKFNMFDYHGVIHRAYELGEYATVSWIYDNKPAYYRGIHCGFVEREGN